MGRVSVVGGELCCLRQAPCRPCVPSQRRSWVDEPLGEVPGGLPAHPAAVAVRIRRWGRLKIMVAFDGRRFVRAADQTGQESRSAGHRAAVSVTAMDITIQSTFLPHDDADASLTFYRDSLGFEVRKDVGNGKQRWITVSPPDQPGTSIVLHPPAANRGLTDEERRTITEMMAKGTYAVIILATADLDGTFARLQASHAEVVQEPTEHPYGVRDCAFRDPAGNTIRINELR
jgi:catechol 2,3-dioxygenase-like lactoylglutathione lyase family enzyme